METEILAMYDIRGIQSFIFRTNKVKEIKGASGIVENIIGDSLKYAIAEVSRENDQVNEKTFIISWENEERISYFTDNSIQAQVLFIGGGNAYIIYRSRKLALSINRKMSRYVLDKTYSLQLAIAMVPKSESYSEDYKNVQNKMSEIKASMPYSGCLGALPVMDIDDMTGFPYCVDDKDKLKRRSEYQTSLTSESIQKLIAYYNKNSEGEEKKHDNLITEYKKESMLAVVHMDGNNMGMRIRELMEGDLDYETAVRRMRIISRNINNSFKETFKTTERYIEGWIKSDANKILKKEYDKKPARYIRKILVAGDDITFVCNARLALPIVKYFTEDVAKKSMYQSDKGEIKDSDTEENLKKYGFSVCAGIAFVHSHFPFATAYEVAEECCSSAKKRAKKAENMEGGRCGNWVDFQICRSVHNRDLEKSRKKDYTLSENEWLLRRPYYLKINNNAYQNLNEINKQYSFENFEKIMDFFKYNKNMPSSMAKEFRNTYPLGTNALEELIVFAKSRNKLEYILKEQGLSGDGQGYIMLEEKRVAAWYDVLEMLDYYTKIEQ